MILARHVADDEWEAAQCSGKPVSKEYLRKNGKLFTLLARIAKDDPPSAPPDGYVALHHKAQPTIQCFTCGTDEYICVVEFGDGDAKPLIDIVTDAAAMAVEIDQLFIGGRTDHLTQLGNRYALEDWFEASPESVILFCDLDDFKWYNNRSWALGDEVLRRVGRSLSDVCKKQLDPPLLHARPLRWGGDEFAVVCEVDGNPTQAALEATIGDFCGSIFKVLSQERHILYEDDEEDVDPDAPPTVTAGKKIPFPLPRGIGASIGVCLPSAEESGRRVKHAQRAAKAAKSQGKGQVCYWHEIQKVVELERKKVVIKERQGDIVLLERGSADGIRRDMLFEVLWTSETAAEHRLKYSKGTIRVTDVRENLSVCRVVTESLTMKDGDKVRLA